MRSRSPALAVAGGGQPAIGMGQRQWRRSASRERNGDAAREGRRVFFIFYL